jgi:uncharacterized membrane protein YgcG
VHRQNVHLERRHRTSRSICSSISKVGNTANTALSTLSICSISTCKYLVFARKTEYLLSTCSVTVLRAEVFHCFTTLRLETGRSTRAALCPLVPSPPSRTIHTPLVPVRAPDKRQPSSCMHMRHNMCESAHDRPAGEPHATPNGRLAHGHLARTRHQPASPCGGRRAEAARAEAAHDCRRAAAGVHGGRSEGETQGEDTSDDDLAGQHDRAEDEGRGRRPRRERRTGRRRIGGGRDEHGGGGNGGGGLAGGGRDDDHVAAPQTTQPARAAQPQALVSTPGLAREGLGEASSHGHAPRRKAGVSALAPAVARGVATLVMLMVAQCFSATVSWGPCLHGHAAALTVRAMPREWSAGNAGRVRRRASGTGDSSAPGPGAVGPADFRPLPECWLR